MAEVASVLWFCVFGFAEGFHVHKLNVHEFRRARDECVDERLRRAATRLDPDSISGAHGLHGLRGAQALASVLVLPAHNILSPGLFT
jgi:hypothetical protein